MTENQMFGFMGGVAERVPAGKAMLPDRDTGELKEVIWDDHIRVTYGRTIHKFKWGELEAISNLMKDQDFVKVAKECR
jgi:uncharacterized protein (UPF0216 family)